jgi:hypothetical protein
LIKEEINLNQENLLLSVINDLTYANPHVTRDLIISGIQSVVTELLPVIVSNVKIQKKVWSPIKLAIQDFQQKRRRVASKSQRRLTSNDIISVLNSAQATIEDRSRKSDNPKSVSKFKERIDSPMNPNFYRMKLAFGNTAKQEVIGLNLPQTLLFSTYDSNAELYGFGSPNESSRDIFELDVNMGFDDSDDLNTLFVGSVERSVREFVFYELPTIGLNAKYPIILSKVGGQFHLTIRTSRYLATEVKNVIGTVLQNSVRHNLKFITNDFQGSTELKAKISLMHLNLKINFVSPVIKVTEIRKLTSFKKSKRHELLNLENINEISRVTVDTNEKEILKLVNDILKLDISTRNKRYGVNCMSELHPDKRHELGEISFYRNTITILRNSVKERIRAVLLNELDVLTKTEMNRFFNGELTHKEYVENINRFTSDVASLWS